MRTSIASRPRARNWRDSSGQSVAEFALVLPILAIILMAILQFAFIFGTQIGLTNAAREAARFASVVRTDKVATAPNSANSHGPAVRAELIDRILPNNVQSYVPGNLNAGQTKVCYQSFTDASGATAIRVKVDVAYGHPLFIPLIADWLTNGSGLLTVTASEQLPVENPPIVTTDISSADPGNCY
jgi:Flp pilus assembly protein TadG